MFRRPKSPSRVVHPIVFDSSRRDSSQSPVGSWILVPPAPREPQVRNRVPISPLRALAGDGVEGQAVDLERRLKSLLQRVEDQAVELENLRDGGLPTPAEPELLIPRLDRKISRRRTALMRSIFKSNQALRKELAGSPPGP